MDLIQGMETSVCVRVCVCVCVCITDLGSLWILFLGVVQEGGHVVVQIRLETVDQVPVRTHDSTLKTTIL